MIEGKTGLKRSPETKARMSESRLEWLKTHPHGRLGKTTSEETKERIRQSKLGKKNPRLKDR